ncbi:MAG: glycosidase [Desulfurococcaceae archaeon]
MTLPTWPKAVNYENTLKVRSPETRDIVKRLGAISPDKVFLNNHPIANPIAVFNPTFVLKDDIAEVYARIIVGYYLYVSAIVRMEIPLNDILSGTISINYYSAELAIYPSTRYDIWGCEDPRVTTVNNRTYMTYAGRSVNYFVRPPSPESVLPITALLENRRAWSKAYVHVLKNSDRRYVVHDKDAFLLELDNRTLLFHRPLLVDGSYHLVISEVKGLDQKCENKLCELSSENTVEIMPPARFEEKIGWATPVLVKPTSAVLLVHGVDREMHAYRVFAVEIEYEHENFVVKAVTPFYIMEPKTPYEVYGDRPFTVFPCGAQIVDDKVIVAYGAADYLVGFGSIDLAELMSALEKGRVA